MPFVNLVRNKEITNERRKYDVFGVHGETTNDDFIEYIDTHDTLKIMVTYNSIGRVVDLLTQKGYDVYKEFFLLVDECHILFNSYSFRHEAILKLLKTAQHFERVTYMSATPIEEEFILEELRHLPTVTIN